MASAPELRGPHSVLWGNTMCGLIGDMFLVYSGTVLQTIDLKHLILTVDNFAMAIWDFYTGLQ